jgi:uncharacterized protein (TIGR03437 family)
MKRILNSSWVVCLLVIGLLGLSGTLLQLWGEGINFEHTVSANSTAGPAVEGTIFAVTTGNNLISFNQFAPNAIIKTTAITGLQSGENILGIDFRPRTGQLYAVSNQNRLFTVNTSTGAATQVGTTPLSPALNGTSFGFDFNPVPDRIRLVSDAYQNLRLHPDTGAVAATDGNLAFAQGDPNAAANPNVAGVAYTNSFSGATTTTLYGIDSNLDALVLQGSQGGAPVSPNTGQLTTVGPLGVNTSDQVGFDIASPSGLAFASLTAVGATTSSLYTINLQTGAATLVGPIGGTEIVRDIAAVLRVETIFALTTANGLVSFSAGNPGVMSTVTPITGLNSGENLVGIDFRPANGLLYALSNQGRVYTINTTNGVATLVGAAPFSPAVAGANFGFDFNPVPDRIRVTSDADQNLRLNPNNGALAGADGNLAFAGSDANANANPTITGAAYTNNFAGTTTTSLYGIDSNLNILVLQGSIGGTPVSPNTGQLTTVGPLGVDPTDEVGFDIAPVTGAAFASLNLAGASMLTTINLATGAATMIGPIGGGQTIRDIAVLPRVETIFAATNGNRLISFVSTAPGVIQTWVQITGLADETIIGIDFRPANGMLYAIGSSSRIYTINPVTGVATQVGSGITTPQLNGVGYGFDFNPVPDRIRVVSTATHNLRFVPDTGASAAIDPPLAYAPTDQRAGQPAFITGAAYDNSFAGSTTTTLYTIDSNFDSLVRQGSPGSTPISPNSGQLFTIGPLGVDTNEMVGFDIADCTNNAYASLTVGGVSQLHVINLQTGAATLIGNIGGGEVIRGIAVVNNATPSSQPLGMAVVNAASFFGEAIAPDSLAAVFGRFQTSDGKLSVAAGFPLPTMLGGVRVTVNGQDAQLLMASNAQINLVAPPNIPDGPATVVITGADGSVRSSRINMARAAAGIFSMRATGQGTAAAVWTTDGVVFQPVMNPDGSERPINAGTAASPTFLILFTTGLRKAPAANPNDGNGVAEAVTATIKGANANVTFAGPAPGFAGLDQVNMIIPPQLAGSGTVEIMLTVGGKVSNAVTVRIN